MSFRIEHLAIWVEDLERMKQFYAHYFGGIAGEMYHNPTKNFKSYFLSFGNGARLELMHKPEIPATQNDPHRQFTGLIHFAFSTGSQEQVDALTAQLRQDGFDVVDGPRHTGDGYYESAVLDPEGNRLEITI